MFQGRLSRSLVIARADPRRHQPEDPVSTYIDPATALTIARQARAEQMGRAEQYHQTRVARGRDVPADGPRPRRRWHLMWRRTATAH